MQQCRMRLELYGTQAQQFPSFESRNVDNTMSVSQNTQRRVLHTNRKNRLKNKRYIDRQRGTTRTPARSMKHI